MRENRQRRSSGRDDYKPWEPVCSRLARKDCRTGNVLVEEQVQAAKKEDVLNALGEIASKFRTRLGESLTTVQEHNTPLAEATTFHWKR